MAKLVVLLDDGGVLNDNALRGGQWQRLVGEFFVPILGGTAAAWADANRVVLDRMVEPVAWDGLLKAAPDYAGFERRYYRRWLGDMCAIVGVRQPTEDQCLALGVASERFIAPRIRAAFPGAVEAVRALRAEGYELYMASGASSTMLGMTLEAMDVRDCFGRLYGPDLINTFKSGPDYYERLLADLGVAPQDAVVVDDSPAALGWAAQAGARTVLIGQREGASAFRQVGRLAEVPEMLHTLEVG